MWVVENQLVPDPNESSAEGLAQVRFGEHFGWWASSDCFGIQQQHLITSTGIVKFVGRHNDYSTGRNLLVDHIENDRLRGEVEPRDGLVQQQHIAVLRTASSYRTSSALVEITDVMDPTLRC